MRKEKSLWENAILLRRREDYKTQGWKEIEGCRICFGEQGIEYTMPWKIEPPQKCAIHPRHYVLKALMPPRLQE